MNSTSLKIRLIIMNFLQYAVWGSWLISAGSYFRGIGFTPVQVGSIFAAQGIASLFMPALLGIVADRWIPAQKVLGLAHLISAGLLIVTAFQTTYETIYPFMLMAVMFFMPTIALSNTVAYNALSKAGLDTAEHFPPIRVFGTIGFICAMWAVDLLHLGTSNAQFFLSAGLGILLGIYAFTLPSCDINRGSSQSFVEKLGLKAFTLFKQKKMAIFFIFSMLLGFSLQITNAFADGYIRSFGAIAEFQGTFGVEHSVMLISLSQVSETLCILLIPFCLRRFGIKKVMLISMFAWVLRFGLLGLGDPGSGVWLFILSMIVYGVAFDFFNISGSLYVDQETDPSIRASAQGVFMIMTNGFGAFFGSYIAGAVVEHFAWPNSWYIFAGYALVVAVLFALVFKYKHNPQEA